MIDISGIPDDRPRRGPIGGLDKADRAGTARARRAWRRFRLSAIRSPYAGSAPHVCLVKLEATSAYDLGIEHKPGRWRSMYYSADRLRIIDPLDGILWSGRDDPMIHEERVQLHEERIDRLRRIKPRLP